MALDVLPNRHFGEGVQAEVVAPAEESYRREFLLAENRDDPVQTNTARPRDKFGGDEAFGQTVSELGTHKLWHIGQTLLYNHYAIEASPRDGHELRFGG